MKEIKVGLDLKEFSRLNGGIGRYTKNIVRQLLMNDTFSYTGFSSPNTELNALKEISNLNLADGFFSRVRSTFIRSLFLLPARIHSLNLDVFHSMDNSTVAAVPGSKAKRVATIHDLVVFRFPEFFTKKHERVVKNLTSFAIKHADLIIADSESTKNDILEFFPGTSSRKIEVIHLAVSDLFSKTSETEINETVQQFRIPQRYFLSLATYEPRKNLKNVIKSFEMLKKNKEYDDVGLVLVGGAGWLDSGVEMERSDLEQKKIIPLGYIEDRYLPALYSGALAFVYPSFYEGFGLPILEAMSCGKAIITSHNSSLPEIAGDAALYVDPHSLQSINDALIHLIEDDTYRRSLEQRSITESGRFSWELTARHTEEAYLKALEM